MKADSEPPAKCPRNGDQPPALEGLTAFHHLESWYESNKASFSPPVCNKLMHKGQLSIMFVGGPNTRKDFHLEMGSEFFYQIKGDMELPTVQKGVRKLVKIREGEVFCLPSCVPHSPQRPNVGSLGLVVERERTPGELDGLIFYTDFESCKDVHWEQFFHCEDLGKDLPPVIKAYKEFEVSEEGQKMEVWPQPANKRPVQQNMDIEVPDPFSLADFIKTNEAELSQGKVLPLFGQEHPDFEFQALVAGGPATQVPQPWAGDTWLYQLKGSAELRVQGGMLTLEEGCCCIVQPSVPYEVSRAAGSVGLVVMQDAKGNKA